MSWFEIGDDFNYRHLIVGDRLHLVLRGVYFLVLDIQTFLAACVVQHGHLQAVGGMQVNDERWNLVSFQNGSLQLALPLAPQSL